MVTLSPRTGKFNLTFLINRETLIKVEGSKILSKGRVEKSFYYIKIHVEGGKFLKIK